MQQTALTRRIPVVMWVAVTLTVTMVSGTLFFAAKNANDIAARNSIVMIGGSVRAELDRMAATVRDYAVWDAAFAAAGRRDVPWLYENLGSGVDYGQFNFMEVYWPSDRSSLVWTAGSGAVRQSGAIDPDVIADVNRQLNALPAGAGSPVTFATSIGDVPYLVSAARIAPQTPGVTGDATKRAIVFIGRRLDAGYIADIGTRFLIDDLHLTFDPQGQAFQVALPGADGTTFAHVGWTPPRPGLELAKASVAPLAMLLLVFLVLSRIVANAAADSTRQLMVREQEAAALARRDHHTGLPNRLAFQERYEALVTEDASVAMLLTDLNGFKQINDTKGHAVGDALITGLARRITETIDDDTFVARMGGDEFSFIFRGSDAEDRLRGFAQALKAALRAAFYLEGEPFRITMAMGYSVRMAADDLPPAELVRQADAAMYASKSSGSAMLVKYDAALDPNRLKELALESALRRAVEHPEEFSVVYQPIHGCSGAPTGMAEALLRWQSPNLGEVSPADFIPVAEASGLIGRVTSIVLEAVCRDLAQSPETTACINISPLQINDTAFHDELGEAVRRHGIKAHQIVIELTEGVLVENPGGLAEAIQRLRKMGHKLALDDFGSGFSSIGYLRNMEFSLLKVDKSLTRGALSSQRARDLLVATVQIAKAFNIDILAEGVETEEQSRLLAEMGFHMQQGFKFGPARPFAELPAAEFAA